MAHLFSSMADRFANRKQGQRNPSTHLLLPAVPLGQHLPIRELQILELEHLDLASRSNACRQLSCKGISNE
jgi:hypothetical protein